MIPTIGMALAGPRNSLYLNHMVQPIAAPQGVTVPARAQSRVATAIVWGGAGFGAVALLGALGLWFHYGTAVFFEMIAAGISSCF